MSLTPASTADKAMNSASNAAAISRANVVLPVPGGPHSIIECSFPDSNARRKGLPGPSKWDCPTTSFSSRGRSCSASGAAGSCCSNKSVTDHVRTFGWAEFEQFRCKARVFFQPRKSKHCRLTEIVVQLHGFEHTSSRKSQAHPFKRTFPGFGRRLKPLRISLHAEIAQIETLFNVAASGK